MTYDAFDDLLLFGGNARIDVAGAVELGLTPVIALAAVQHFINVHRLAAALVLIHVFLARLDARRLRVVATVAHLSDWIVLLAPVASDQNEVRPHLPVNFLPADAEGLPHKSDELLKVPIPVDYVLCPHLTVSVNALESVPAREDFALLLGEQF